MKAKRHDWRWALQAEVQFCRNPSCNWLKDPWSQTRALYKRSEEPSDEWRYIDVEPPCEGEAK